MGDWLRLSSHRTLVLGFVCEESSLARELAQRRQVLSEFHGTQVLAFVVANSEIGDVHELVLRVDPEFSDVLTV